MAVRRFVLMATKQAFVTGSGMGTAVRAKVGATYSSVANAKRTVGASLLANAVHQSTHC
jgi:hypothetical protein